MMLVGRKATLPVHVESFSLVWKGGSSLGGVWGILLALYSGVTSSGAGEPYGTGDGT